MITINAAPFLLQTALNGLCFCCSERYMVTYSKHGMPKDLDLLEKMFALFTVSFPHFCLD